MKRISFFVFLFIWLNAKSQVQVGGRIGAGFSSLEKLDEQSSSYTWRQGMYGGLILNYQIAPQLQVQAELNFSSEGGRKKEMQQVPSGVYIIPGTNSAPPVYASLKTATIVHYLEIPVLAKLLIGERSKYYMCLGPYYSILLDANQQATGNSLVYLDANGSKTLTVDGPTQAAAHSYFDDETNITARIRKMNFGFIGASGFEHRIGNGSLLLEFRLKLGLQNINAYPSEDGRHQATSISLTAGYVYSLKKKRHAHK